MFQLGLYDLSERHLCGLVCPLVVFRAVARKVVLDHADGVVDDLEVLDFHFLLRGKQGLYRRDSKDRGGDMVHIYRKPQSPLPALTSTRIESKSVPIPPHRYSAAEAAQVHRSESTHERQSRHD